MCIRDSFITACDTTINFLFTFQTRIWLFLYYFLSIVDFQTDLPTCDTTFISSYWWKALTPSLTLAIVFSIYTFYVLFLYLWPCLFSISLTFYSFKSLPLYLNISLCFFTYIIMSTSCQYIPLSFYLFISLCLSFLSLYVCIPSTFFPLSLYLSTWFSITLYV